MAGKHGGYRPGAGRPPGATDKVDSSQRKQLSKIAQQYTEIALQVLVDVAQNSQSDAARVAAANSLLDRGHGKPTQAVEHSGPGGEPIPFEGFDLTVVTDAPSSEGD